MKYLIGLGSNLGNREDNILNSHKKLAKYGRILKESSIQETKPWGLTDQPSFLNQVLLFESELKYDKLMIDLVKIEFIMGRNEEIRWGPRLIDIDLLWGENLNVNKNGIIIPHPFIHKRDFVLDGIIEITPDLIHPIFKKAFKELRINY